MNQVKPVRSNTTLQNPHTHNQSTSPELSRLTNDDRSTWENYIGKVFSGPEMSFKPNKGKDTSLKSKLDLHGMTIQQAFNNVRMFIEEHWSEGSKYVVIVTGKSGKISDEFTSWCSNLLQIRTIEPIGDTDTPGAWLITLKTRK